MTVPQPPEVLDDEAALVRPLAKIIYTFCAALVVIGLLGVFVLVPDAVITLGGLALGLGLGLVSLVVPALVIRYALSSAARRGVAPGSEYGIVRSAVFLGLAFAETPALLALALSASSTSHEVGSLVLSVPLAIVSLLVNVAGPGATRRHLSRLRAGTTPGLAPM